MTRLKTNRTAKRLLRAALFAAAVGHLSCGGGDSGPVAPQAPRPEPRQLTGLEIVAERTGIRVGQQIAPLVAYGQYDDGTTGTVNVEWSSSDEAVVEVGSDGVVRGAGIGTAEVTGSFEEFSASVRFEVDEPEPRFLEDRPDDFGGPQIHVVYALPSDREDRNLDRWGNIAVSFEAIQNWLTSEIGYRLHLDTHQGELDVTFLPLPFTHQEGDGQSGGLVFALEQEIRSAIGIAPNKIYAVYYDGRSAGVCGSATLGGQVGAVYVHPDCSQGALGADPDVASTYEAVMVHELFHNFGAVDDCAPNQGGGAHVQDDPVDVMYAGADRGGRDEAVIDVARDDYFGHGRSGCLDVARSRFWAPVSGAAQRADLAPSIVIPPADRPFLCDAH